MDRKKVFRRYCVILPDKEHAQWYFQYRIALFSVPNGHRYVIAREAGGSQFVTMTPQLPFVNNEESFHLLARFIAEEKLIGYPLRPWDEAKCKIELSTV